MAINDYLSFSRKLTEIIFDRMPMGIAVLDRQFILLRANPTWASYIERYTTTPATKVVPGARFADLAPGTEATTLRRYRRAMSGEVVREAAVPMESNGIISYWDVVVSPLVHGGEIIGIVDVTTDVTERKRVELSLRSREEELERHRVHLEETVSARTAELTQVNLELHHEVEERKRAEQTLGEHTRTLSTLLEVSHNLASTLELEPLLGVILDQLKVVIEYSAATIFALDGDTLSIIAYRGPIPQDEAARIRFPLGDAHVNRQVIQERQPVLIGDVRGETRLARQFQETAGPLLDSTFGYIRSWLGVPLMAKNRVIGMLTLDHGEPNYYQSGQAELVMAFANQVAVAIENARLYAETWRRADELQTLLNVQQAINRRLDPDAVLQLVADEARRLTYSQRTAVFLTDGDALRLSVLSGDDDPRLLGYCMPLAASVTGAALRTGRPIRLDYGSQDRPANADPIEYDGVKSMLSVPLFSGKRPIGAITVFDRLAGTYEPEDERILSMMASGAITALENARLYREEQDRRREAEQRRRVAEGLRDILAALNSHRPLEEMLDLIIAQACRLLGTETGALFRLQTKAGVLSIQASRGLPPDYVTRMTVPVGHGLVGRAVAERRPIVVTDIEEAMPPMSEQDATLRAGLAWLTRLYRGVIAVPLTGRDQIHGAIMLYYPQSRDFSAEELDLAVSFADQAALAIDNAELRAQAEQAAVAAERSRLARDLHDAVTQTLFSTSLIAQVLPRIWEQDAEEGKRRLAELGQLTRGALAEMRALLLELRPAALAEVPLEDLLRQLAEATTGRGRVPVTLEVKGKSDLPPDVKVALYRIAQEALNNVAKHSGARRAVVELLFSEERAELSIEDNGRGFDPGQITPDHLGLGIMRERAEAVGAALNVESASGRGTRIAINWSAKKEEEA